MEISSTKRTASRKTHKSSQYRKLNKDVTLRKRHPHKLELGDNVIYVNNTTSIKTLLDRCNKLIVRGEHELKLLCLGAAVQKGTLLALKLTELNVGFNIDVNTYTAHLIDDLEPLVDELDYAEQRRYNSALRIRIFRAKDTL